MHSLYIRLCAGLWESDIVFPGLRVHCWRWPRESMLQHEVVDAGAGAQRELGAQEVILSE